MERLKNDFNLNQVHPSLFWKSEWTKADDNDRPSKRYIIYRSAFLLYFFGTTIFNMYRSNMNFYFIYLTNWMYFLQFLYALFYVIRLICIWFKWTKFAPTVPVPIVPTSNSAVPIEAPEPSPQLPIPEKILWILLNVVSSIPYAVSIGFFMLLYMPPEPLSKKTFTTLDYVGTFMVHAANSPMSLMDSLVMAVPMRISHMVFPFALLLIYTFFAVMYEVSGAPYPYIPYDENKMRQKGIYPFLNWKERPGIAVSCIIAGAISVCVMHFIFGWCLYRLRNWIKIKYFSAENDQAADGETGLATNGPSAVEIVPVDATISMNPEPMPSEVVDKNVEVV